MTHLLLRMGCTLFYLPFESTKTIYYIFYGLFKFKSRQSKKQNQVLMLINALIAPHESHDPSKQFGHSFRG